MIIISLADWGCATALGVCHCHYTKQVDAVSKVVQALPEAISLVGYPKLVQSLFRAALCLHQHRYEQVALTLQSHVPSITRSTKLCAVHPAQQVCAIALPCEALCKKGQMPHSMHEALHDVQRSDWEPYL